MPELSPHRVRPVRKPKPATPNQVIKAQTVTTSKRIVIPQHHTNGIRPQHPSGDPNVVKRRTSQGDVHKAGTQPSGGIGEINFPKPHANTGVVPPVGDRQSITDLLGAVSKRADGQNVRAGHGHHPGPSLVNLCEQGASLAIKGGPSRSEGHPSRRPM